MYVYIYVYTYVHIEKAAPWYRRASLLGSQEGGQKHSEVKLDFLEIQARKWSKV